MRNATYAAGVTQWGLRAWESRTLSYFNINGHERGETALKVTARFGFETLVYFDFDTHNSGSAADVAILAQAVRDCFPAMPPFVVNERGGSGWLKVDTSRVGRDEYNALVGRLQQFFRSVARSMGLDVEYVEVKGQVYTPRMAGRRCVSVEAGDLFKCPPDLSYLTQPSVEASTFAESRFDPWVLPGAPGVAPDAAQPTAPDDEGFEIVGLAPAHRHDSTLRARDDCGSFRPRLVSDEVAARLGDLEGWASRQFPGRPTRAGRWGLSSRQFAEVLFTFAFLRPKPDGGNPCKRHAHFISALHAAGVFGSGYVHARYKCVRDYVSSVGGIDWRDNTCRPERDEADGVACKWGLDPALQRGVESVLGICDTTHTVHFTCNDTIINFTGTHRVPTMVRLAECLAAQAEWEQVRLAELFAAQAA